MITLEKYSQRAVNVTQYITSRIQAREGQGMGNREAVMDATAVLDENLYSEILKAGDKFWKHQDTFLLNFYNDAKNWK